MSWLETAGTLLGVRVFDVSFVIFMVATSLLMFRLHLRRMYAQALAAGVERPEQLYRAPWRSVAGPGLAVVSILAICLLSYFLAPLVQTGVETLTGNPTIAFTPPRLPGSGVNQEQVSLEIGQGPTTASDLPILRMEFSGPVRYLRERVYDTYRGRGWSVAATFDEMRPENLAPVNVEGAKVFSFPVDRAPMTEPYVATIESVSRPLRYLPVPGIPRRIEFPGVLNVSRRGTVIMPQGGLPSNTAYAVYGFEYVPDEAILRRAPAIDYGRIYSIYIQRDRYDRRVVDLARAVAQRYDNQYDKVMALKRLIETTCKYNLQARAIDEDVDKVYAFLNDTREGYCDLFASSLAVLCRANGIPARVVAGYIVLASEVEGNSYTVRDRHAHLWTEIYFEGIGWVPFDATEGADAVPGAGVGSALSDDEGKAAILYLTIGSVVVGVALLALIVYAFRRWRRSWLAVPQEQRALAAAYRRFLRLVRAVTRRAKAPSETTREYVRQVAGDTPDPEQLERLGEQFDLAMYGPKGPTEDLLRAIEEELVAVGKWKRKGRIGGNGRNAGNGSGDGR
jgi:transglutaminase-like putative cysteine protease